MHLARDSQAHFWVKISPGGVVTSCCFALLCFALRRRHGEAGMADHAGTMPPFHCCPLCTDLCIVPSPSLHPSLAPLSPLTPPASWHGDGSAVDKVHNTPSSPRHNSGTWTQAPLWHTREAEEGMLGPHRQVVLPTSR